LRDWERKFLESRLRGNSLWIFDEDKVVDAVEGALFMGALVSVASGEP
jgi:hypothetical protein